MHFFFVDFQLALTFKVVFGCYVSFWRERFFSVFFVYFETEGVSESESVIFPSDLYNFGRTDVV